MESVRSICTWTLLIGLSLGNVGQAQVVADTTVLPGSHTLEAVKGLSIPVQQALNSFCAQAHPSQVGIDTERRGSWLNRAIKTRGQVSAGASYGRLPMTAPQPSPWNGALLGNVGIDVLGLPLQLTFDLGTDVPLRGQRQRIALSFDADRFTKMYKWDLPRELHDSALLEDSLRARKNALFTNMRGAMNAVNALRALSATTPANQPVNSLDSSLNVSQPLPPIPLSDTLGTAELNAPSSVELVSENSEHFTTLDSLTQAMDHYASEMRKVDDQLAEVAELKQRSEALSRMTGLGGTGFGRTLSGLKRLQIGTCTPTSSDLLIDGVMFKGVSLEYTLNDLHIGFDHGTSYDDVWLNTAPMQRQLNALQESLFITDEQDLTPKKLTAVRLGAGERDRTFVRVGFLSGSAPGLPGTLPDIDERAFLNKVVGFETGTTFHKTHSVVLAYARSIVTSRGNEENEEGLGPSDLFNTQSSDGQAAKLSYTGDIERSRTQVNLTGRYFGPVFHSVGLGFIRRNSRSGTVGLTQNIGPRLKVRVKLTKEHRLLQESDGQGRMDLTKGFLNMQYRHPSGLTLRATYVPVVYETVSSGNMGNLGRNQMVGFGTDVRKRWGKNVLYGSVDGSRYAWHTAEGIKGNTTTGTARMGMDLGGQWTWQLSYMAAQPNDTTVRQVVSDLGLSVSHRSVEKGFRGSASAHYTDDARIGWGVELTKDVMRMLSLTVVAQRITPQQIYFPQDDHLSTSDSYTCQVRIGYRW